MIGCVPHDVQVAAYNDDVWVRQSCSAALDTPYTSSHRRQQGLQCILQGDAISKVMHAAVQTQYNHTIQTSSPDPTLAWAHSSCLMKRARFCQPGQL